MGMYTELYIACRIKGDAPAEVIEALKVMTGRVESEELPAIDHPHFKKGRSSWMLRCSSYYFVPQAMQHFAFDEIGKYWVLIVRCDLKNYEDEIESFVDWLTPYIDAYPGDHLGHTRYEEATAPTLLYHPNTWVDAPSSGLENQPLTSLAGE